MDNSTNVLKTVFLDIKYVLIAVIFAFAFYFLNAVIVQWKNINTLGLDFLLLLVFGLYSIVTTITFVNLIIISVLTGILISLLWFRFKNKIYASGIRKGFIYYVGMFLGAFAPGCASCGIGVAAVLGLSSSILFLPFKGAEIGFIAIILILYSIIKVLKDIANVTCSIKN